jgi:hypothetical protein
MKFSLINAPFNIVFLLMLLWNNPAMSQSVSIDTEKQAIKDVIQQSYVEGLQNEGNVKKIDAGFHPGFNLLGIGKGDNMWELPIYTWKENTINDLKSGKKPRKGDDEVTVNFINIDVTGTAAVVKLEFFVGEKKTYVDYISLYKFESGWKIVNKIFYKLPETEE